MVTDDAHRQGSTRVPQARLVEREGDRVAAGEGVDRDRCGREAPTGEHLRKQAVGRVPHEHWLPVQRVDDVDRVIGDLLDGLPEVILELLLGRRRAQLCKKVSRSWFTWS
jgi:hypothetical protein